MKLFAAVLGLLSFSAIAQNVTLRDWNYTLTDVSRAGLSTERLYSSMERDFIKVTSSICSNRALMWNNDFKNNYNLETAKVYMFYTGVNGRVGSKTWWYHVSPVVADRGQIVTMDAGFPAMFNKPMTLPEWFQEFAGTTSCHEIKMNETGLVERMFRTQVFPQTTEYGSANCYYIIAPGMYWTPESVAMAILGRDAEGNPTNYSRMDFDYDDLMQACSEASTSRFGSIFLNNKKKCDNYIRSGRYPRN